MQQANWRRLDRAASRSRSRRRIERVRRRPAGGARGAAQVTDRGVATAWRSLERASGRSRRDGEGRSSERAGGRGGQALTDSRGGWSSGTGELGAAGAQGFSCPSLTRTHVPPLDADGLAKDGLAKADDFEPPRMHARLVT
uniref:Uncharacterized protein n=1 Tax=Oryza brachyantha TaxID=4533 RepID=J3LMW5_ORYBR